MLGEVRKQGAYTVSALSTTINALLSCGGIKESGSLRKIQLKRAGKVISTLDLYDLLLRGDTSADKALQPGDVIFVPVIQNQITISGAVKERNMKFWAVKLFLMLLSFPVGGRAIGFRRYSIGTAKP